MVIKLSKEKIKEIAQELDLGMNCFINIDTGEYEILINKSLNPYWDDDESIFKEIEERIESWENLINIEPPCTELSFQYIEQFIDDIIPTGSSLQDELYEAISKRKPFRNFRNIIDCSDYRETWFVFKEERLIEYINREISLI